MRSAKSKTSEKKPKTNGPANDIIEIRYAPLPPEKVEAYQQSIRFIAKMLIEIVNEEELIKLDVLHKKRCLEVLGTNDQVQM